MAGEARATQYTCVVRLVNYYVAAHVNGRTKRFISDHPERDLRTAQAAARSFADRNNIFYNSNLCDMSPPPLTVLKYGARWYPGELHPNRITLIEKFGPLDLGGTQEEAIHWAHVIALSRGADSVPSIGLSLGDLGLQEQKHL